MWFGQDLSEVKENQRRGGVAVKIVLPAVNNSPAANSQLTSASNQNKSNGKSSQAFGYAKGSSSGWVVGQKRATREAEAERAVISEDARLAEEARTEAYVDVIDEIQAMADVIESRDALAVDEIKSTLMEAALTLAEVPLGAELSDRETGTKSTLKRALSMNDPKEIVKVNMNPQDAGTLNSLGAECSVKPVPDAELDPGDVVVYMPGGLLDARLPSAVERAREALATVQAVEE